LISDSIFYGPKVGIDTSTLLPGGTSGNSLITLDNVEFAAVPVAVRDGNQKTILPGNQKIKSWTLGNLYHPGSPNGTFDSASGSFTFMHRNRLPGLDSIGPQSGMFEKNKPQYENVPSSGFTDVKSFGARGDGRTDDTKAINAALESIAKKSILYFPAGSYIVTDTIKVSR
jgi:hypothetical protein